MSSDGAHRQSPCRNDAKPDLEGQDGQDSLRVGSLDSLSTQDTLASARTRVRSITHLTVATPSSLRATEAAVPLQQVGRMLRASTSGSKDFEQSFPVNALNEFWSHSWCGEPLTKIATLFIYYNSLPAVVVSCVAAGVGSLLCLHYQLSLGWCELVSSVSSICLFCVTLLCWKSRRRVFLDKVCIEQTDPVLKTQGICSLGGVLRCSQTLLVLWDKSYCTRLWCMFELAAFSHLCQFDPNKKIHIRATCHSKMVLYSWIVSVSYRIVFVVLTATVDHDILASHTHYAIVHASPRYDTDTDTHYVYAISVTAIFVAFSMLATSVRGMARDEEFLGEQLDTFSIRNAECFCCSCDHCHPRTGEHLICDRQLVESSIIKWFGTLDAFDDYVHQVVRPKLIVQVGISYRTVMLMGLPNMLECATRVLGNGCELLARFDSQHVILDDLICWFSFMFVRLPLVVEVFRQTTFLARRPGPCFLADALKSVLAALAAAFGVAVIYFASFDVAFTVGGLPGVICASVLGACVVVLIYWDRMFP